MWPCMPLGKSPSFSVQAPSLWPPGKKNISEMVGIGRRMPITHVGFFYRRSQRHRTAADREVFSASWYLVLGTVGSAPDAHAGRSSGSSLLNAAYFLLLFTKPSSAPTKRLCLKIRSRGSPVVCGAAGHNGDGVHRPVFLSDNIFKSGKTGYRRLSEERPCSRKKSSTILIDRK